MKSVLIDLFSYKTWLGVSDTNMIAVLMLTGRNLGTEQYVCV